MVPYAGQAPAASPAGTVPVAPDMLVPYAGQARGLSPQPAEGPDPSKEPPMIYWFLMRDRPLRLRLRGQSRNRPVKTLRYEELRVDLSGKHEEDRIILK